jgi:hypothetical protein
VKCAPIRRDNGNLGYRYSGGGAATTRAGSTVQMQLHVEISGGINGMFNHRCGG